MISAIVETGNWPNTHRRRCDVGVSVSRVTFLDDLFRLSDFVTSWIERIIVCTCTAEMPDSVLDFIVEKAIERKLFRVINVTLYRIIQLARCSFLMTPRSICVTSHLLVDPRARRVRSGVEAQLSEYQADVHRCPRFRILGN